MWNSIEPLTHVTFWFTVFGLPFDLWTSRLLLAIIITFFLVGFGSWIMAALSARRIGSWRQALNEDGRVLARRVGRFSIYAGVFGAVWFFCTIERIPYLSMRAWVVVWVLLIAWWMRRVWLLARHELPQERARRQARAAYEKWLPKPKR